MVQLGRRPRSVWLFGLLVLLFPGQAWKTQAADPERAIATGRDQRRIQTIVNDFMARLGMAQRVSVTVVPRNPLVVSVEVDDEAANGFLLTLQEDFIGELTEQELEAAVAHEVGHVWIFTHHPFLQSEALANQIAQRLVPRSTLVQVYEKVWKRQGRKGDLSRFVGD